MSSISDHECQGQTLVDRIKFWGETDPDTPAFIFWSPAGRRVLTWGDVLDLSSRFAYRLTQRGVKPGDVVCIALPNCPERVVAEFGVQLAGAVAMNGQVLRTDGEDLIASLIKAKCSFVVLDPNHTLGAWQIIMNMSEKYTTHEGYIETESTKIPCLTRVFTVKMDGSKDVFLKGLLQEDKLICEMRTENDICQIFSTSGSTGYSKLVPHAHKTILTYSYFSELDIQLRKNTKFLNIAPLGWLGGYPGPALFYGITHVAIDESLGIIADKASFLWNLICKEDVSIALLVPSLINVVHEGKEKCSGPDRDFKLKTVMTGGQPCGKETINQTRSIANSLLIAYGSTEITFVAKTKINLKDEIVPPNMVGYPAPFVKVKIVNNNLQVLPHGSRGEILVHSPLLCKGYISGESQDAFLADGWFRTGDVGYLREDGCLFVEGRGSDAIMHGAYILYPSWLEQKLVSCPGVKDVVIVPVPDKVLHHEICACVKLDETAEASPSAEDIIIFYQSQILLDKSSALNVVPKYVLFFTEYPLTNTKKVNRRALAEAAKERLSL